MEKAFGIKIKLSKYIPVTAGLGGGSADCAATLKGLNQLLNLNLSFDELCKIGKEIGADVPICINSEACFMSGIGEVITKTHLKDSLFAVLVNNMQQLSTAQVFSEYSKSFREREVKLELPQNNIIKWLLDKHNDLTLPALKVMPELSGVFEALRNTRGVELIRMSGSGATCFAIYNNENLAT